MAATPEEQVVDMVPTINEIGTGPHSGGTTPPATDGCVELLPDLESHSSASLANRRTRRVIRPPHRFRDILPEPPAALPPPELVAAGYPTAQAHEMRDVSMFHRDLESFLRFPVLF
jgi:hypothetical protein